MNEKKQLGSYGILQEEIIWDAFAVRISAVVGSRVKFLVSICRRLSTLAARLWASFQLLNFLMRLKRYTNKSHHLALMKTSAEEFQTFPNYTDGGLNLYRESSSFLWLLVGCSKGAEVYGAKKNILYRAIMKLWFLIFIAKRVATIKRNNKNAPEINKNNGQLGDSLLLLSQLSPGRVGTQEGGSSMRNPGDFFKVKLPRKCVRRFSWWKMAEKKDYVNHKVYSGILLIYDFFVEMT